MDRPNDVHLRSMQFMQVFDGGPGRASIFNLRRRKKGTTQNQHKVIAVIRKLVRRLCDREMIT
ncbi:hypothetical protein AAZX31_13G144000 [Glycine max]